MKSKKIITLGVSLVTMAANVLYFYPTGNFSSASESRKEVKAEKTEKKQKEDKQKNEEMVSDKKETKTLISTEAEKKKETSLKDKNSDNNTKNETKDKKNDATSSSSKQQEQPKVQTPSPVSTPRVQTEWEKLGISEDAYYNTPAHNEGELAFKGDISQCINEKNRLTNAYYDQGIDGGREYTINGEYTHSYLGCGLYIIMKGQRYKYSEIISMEKQGYFNKST